MRGESREPQARRRRLTVGGGLCLLAVTLLLGAATAKTAAAFSLTDRGRIAPGLRADLLLVAGDPTQDIRATRAINPHRGPLLVSAIVS